MAAAELFGAPPQLDSPHVLHVARIDHCIWYFGTPVDSYWSKHLKGPFVPHQRHHSFAAVDRRCIQGNLTFLRFLDSFELLD